MEWGSTWPEPGASSAPSSECTAPLNSRARAWPWPTCAASWSGMAAACTPIRSRARARPSRWCSVADLHEDLWLERWLRLLRAGSANGRVLELGCANGRDTAWLAQQGFHVIGTDVSADALRVCARAVPGSLVVQHDLRCPLPFPDASFGAVVASLCLHYFTWKDTKAAVAEIRRVLKPPFGIVLARLNSTRDMYHGARDGVRELERHYWEMPGIMGE